MAVLRLLERTECPMCAEAEATLRRWGRFLGFAVERVDVHVAGLAGYADRVPVVIDGDGGVVWEAAAPGSLGGALIRRRLGRRARPGPGGTLPH